MTRFERLEAARLARDPRDFTAPASVEAPHVFKMGTGVVHVERKRYVSNDGLRFEYVGTQGARLNADGLPRRDTLGRQISLGSGGGPGRGAAGWSPEKRKRISARANAARWGK